MDRILSCNKITLVIRQISMLTEEYCKVLCQVDVKIKDVTAFRNAIKRQYHHNWIIDNLPAASILDSEQYGLCSIAPSLDTT